MFTIWIGSWSFCLYSILGRYYLISIFSRYMCHHDQKIEILGSTFGRISKYLFCVRMLNQQCSVAINMKDEGDFEIWTPYRCERHRIIMIYVTLYHEHIFIIASKNLENKGKSFCYFYIVWENIA